ncbi:MAG: hypothetical protein ACLTNK_07885 [Akkermansia muciniphila]
MWDGRGTQACGNRHGCDEMPQWNESALPSASRCRGFPSAPRGGWHTYMEKSWSPAGYDFLLGDYANGHTKEQHGPETAREYFKCSSPSGIFAVQGNHDQYYGWKSAQHVPGWASAHVE